MRPLSLLVSAALAGIGVLAFAGQAQASIKDPHDHPDYKVELEPHGDFIFWRRDYGYHYHYGYHDFGDPEVGLGFRATIEVADPAFIPKINNTVGVSFGIDITNCRYICRNEEVSIWTPVTMQWNFFFNEHWSTFADIGLVMRSDGFYHDVFFDPVFMIGGRYHFNDDISLTMRIGYPFVSVGVSFFAG